MKAKGAACKPRPLEIMLVKNGAVATMLSGTRSGSAGANFRETTIANIG